MTKKEKVVEKLLNNPQSLRYSEIENIFKTDEYKIEERKGSHKKISFVSDEEKYVIIALHNNDCKDVYKIKLKKFYQLTNGLGNK